MNIVYDSGTFIRNQNIKGVIMIKRGKRYSILSAVGLCVRCSAGVSVAVMLLYLFQGLTPALLTLRTGAFIDAAIGLLRSGEYADVGRALTAVSLLVSFDWISNQLLDLLVGRLRIDVREVRNGDGGEGR